MKPVMSNLGLYQTLLADLRQIGLQKTGILTIVGYALRRSGYRAVVLYRLAARCVHKGKLGKYTSFVLEAINYHFNVYDITANAIIAPGLRLSHPVGVVIGKMTIGQNVTIMQNVTLGLRRLTDDYMNPANFPAIGDNVVIMTGAVVTGGIKIR